MRNINVLNLNRSSSDGSTNLVEKTRARSSAKPIFAELSRTPSISYTTATTPRVYKRSQISFFSSFVIIDFAQNRSKQSLPEPNNAEQNPAIRYGDNLLELPIALPALISLCITGSAFAWTRGILETR